MGPMRDMDGDMQAQGFVAARRTAGDLRLKNLRRATREPHLLESRSGLETTTWAVLLFI